VTNILDFTPKIEELNAAMSAIAAVAAKYDPLLQGTGATVFVANFEKALEALKSLIVGTPRWLATAHTRLPIAFNSALSMAAAAPAATASVATAVASANAALTTIDSQMGQLMMTLDTLSAKLAGQLNAFQDATTSLQGARTAVGYWNTTLNAPLDGSQPWPLRWDAASASLNNLTALENAVEDFAALAKVLGGGIDPPSCAALAASNGDVGAAYAAAGETVRRRRLSGSPEETAVLVFAADESVELGATHVMGAAGAACAAGAAGAAGTASAGRALQAGMPPPLVNKLSSSEVARLAALGLPVSASAATTAFSAEFCFAPASASPECAALRAALGSLLPRIVELGGAFTASKAASIASASTLAITQTPAMSAQLSAATANILAIFATAAAAVNATLTDPAVGPAVSSATSTAASLQFNLQRFVNGNFPAAVQQPLLALNSTAGGVRALMADVVSNLPASLGFLGTVPSIITAMAKLPATVGNVRAFTPIVARMNNDMYPLAGSVQPVAADLLTYSDAAAKNALDSFATSLASREQ
jgi:hypothetical protein